MTKRGGATLTLTGDNTYTGTTTVGAGTLELGAGTASGSVVGNIVNNGVLVFNRSDASSYNGVVSGTGDLVQQGSGNIVLRTSQTYSGNTQVNKGALVLADGAQLAGTRQVNVAAGATLGGYGGVHGNVMNSGLLAVADAAPGFSGASAGTFVIGGELINSGEIRLSSPAPASTLAVAGNYTGNAGKLTVSTVLGGDNSPTDKLVVHGSTAGNTRIDVQNAGGSGEQTVNGIEIVQVDGSSSGVFALDSRVVAGAFDYDLFKGGVVTPDDGNWYLRSSSPGPTPVPIPRPEPGAYLGNQRVAQTLFVHTLHDRAGAADASGAAAPDGATPTVWARATGGHADAEAANGHIDQSTDSALVQAGIDLFRHTDGNRRWQAGVMAGYGSATTDSSAQNNPASARGSVNGVSAGVYATWRGNAKGPDGPYFDTWLQYAHFDNTVKGSELAGENYASQVWSASLEGGWAFTVAQTAGGPVMIEPQLQLVYTHFQANDHTESNGTLVQDADSGGLATRVGVRLMRAPSASGSPGWLPFVELNWWYDTTHNAMAFNNVVVPQDGPRNRAELKAGVQADVAKHWRIWGNLALQTGNAGYRSIAGVFGARYSW